MRNLATQTIFIKKIKRLIVSYKMSSFPVYQHCKIEQKLYTAKINLKQN